MKPLHAALLALAGALCGAIVMSVAHKSWKPAPTAVAARSQAPEPPAPVPTAPETPPAVAATPPAPEKPSPVASREAPRPRPRPARPAVPARNPEPVAVAHAAASEVSAPAPEPPQETPALAAAAARPIPENATPAVTPTAPPPPNKVTLNAGMLIPVRLVDGLSSERNNPGDTFTAKLDRELVVEGFVIAERGARAEGRVAASDRGGQVEGFATLTVQLVRLDTSDGQAVAIETDGFEKRAAPNPREDAAKTGAAAAGGGGQPATLPSGTRISFRIHAPVTLTERR
jgi:hypothetical protein